MKFISMEQFNYLSSMPIHNIPYNEKTKKFPRRHMFVNIPQKNITIYVSDSTGKSILVEEYQVSD